MFRHHSTCKNAPFGNHMSSSITSTGIRTTSTGELGEKRTQVRLLWGFSAFQSMVQTFRCKWTNGIFQGCTPAGSAPQ